MSSRRAALRALVAGRQGLVVPGAYDGISARLVQDAGYPAVYMTGSAPPPRGSGCPTSASPGSARWPITRATWCWFSMSR